MVLRRENAALRVEEAATQRETDRLRDILREKEKQVQALREKVARVRKAAREAKEAKVADEAKKATESPEEKQWRSRMFNFTIPYFLNTYLCF